MLGSAFVFDFQKAQTSTHVRKQALNTHTRTQQKNMLGYVSIRNVFKNYVNTHKQTTYRICLCFGIPKNTKINTR